MFPLIFKSNMLKFNDSSAAHPNTGHLAGIGVNYQHWPVDISG
jgi:hypothetical protein